MSDATHILQAIAQGEPHAAEQLLPLVYDELRRLAAAKLANEKPGRTLQPTALVHEAYLRLVDAAQAENWNSRGHFFAAAAEAMRRILVERARQKRSAKRGGDWCRVGQDVGELPDTQRADKLVALDEALARLEQQDPASNGSSRLTEKPRPACSEAATWGGNRAIRSVTTRWRPT